MSTDEHRNSRRIGRLLNVLTGVIATLAVGLVGLLIYNATQPEDFQPITFETVRIQEVTPGGVVKIPQVPGYDAPSVYARDTVPALFDRCSTADYEFSATSDGFWVSQDTSVEYEVPGTPVDVSIETGCVQIRIPFEMPGGMLSDLFLFGESDEVIESRWTIRGSVLPDQAGGVKSYWETEVFTVVLPPSVPSASGDGDGNGPGSGDGSGPGPGTGNGNGTEGTADGS